MRAIIILLTAALAAPAAASSDGDSANAIRASIYQSITAPRPAAMTRATMPPPMPMPLRRRRG